jgi:hypothetical protein
LNQTSTMAMFFAPQTGTAESASLTTPRALMGPGKNMSSFEETLAAILNSNGSKTDKGIKVGGEEKGLMARSPMAELKKLLENLGLPLDSVFLDSAGLSHLEKILSDSGFDQKIIDKCMAQLRQGPLSMEQIMASLGTALNTSESKLTLSETALPYFSRFFQDLGFAPGQIKDMVSELSRQDGFDVKTLRELLHKHGHSNLKELNVAAVDQTNLKELLTALNTGLKDIHALFAQIQKAGGKMSMEKFLSALRTLSEPETVRPAHWAHISAILQNLRFNNTLRAQPKFNRIVSLLQSLGDDRGNQDFLKNSPAAAFLRNGAASARALANSSGFGPGGESQVSNQSGTGSVGSEAEKPILEPWTEMKSGLNRPQQMAESVLKQVAEKIAYSSRHNQHHIRIQLEPKELGQIRIHLIYKNNNLRARIVTENGFVKDALDTQWPQLNKTLAQQGITLERFDVSLDSGQAGFSKKSEEWAESRENRQAVARSRATSVTEPIDEWHPSLRESGSSHVDLMI